MEPRIASASRRFILSIHSASVFPARTELQSGVKADQRVGVVQHRASLWRQAFAKTAMKRMRQNQTGYCLTCWTRHATSQGSSGTASGSSCVPRRSIDNPRLAARAGLNAKPDPLVLPYPLNRHSRKKAGRRSGVRVRDPNVIGCTPTANGIDVRPTGSVGGRARGPPAPCPRGSVR
jgi:hypothetical protein